MQIDMHYYGVYAMARLAGLRPEAARTVAMASQYMDDAVEGEILHHEKGNKLAPIVTAHRIIEIVENRDVNDQPFVWVPFHFFPGNERSENWRTAFAKGQLGIQPGEQIPPYDPRPWDKQRDHFPALDKPDEAAASNVYHFYQAASLRQHYVLRDLLPRHGLVVV